jgi:CBS-domain-containing membrane protein
MGRVIRRVGRQTSGGGLSVHRVLAADGSETERLIDRPRVRAPVGPRDAAHTPVSAVMTRAVTCVRDDVSIEAAAALFLERRLHGAPVLDAEGALVGFVSTTDLGRRRIVDGDTEEVRLRVRTRRGSVYDLGPGFHAEELAPVTVKDVMMPIVVTLHETAPLTLAAALMAYEGVHRIPVLCEYDTVVGILSALDVLRWLAREDGFQIPHSSQVAWTRATPTGGES